MDNTSALDPTEGGDSEASSPNERRDLSAADKESLAIKMYREGKRIRDIEEATGWARRTIYSHLEDEGIIPNRRVGGKSRKESAVTVPADLADAEANVMLDWAMRRLLEQERMIGQLQEQLAEARARLASR